MGGKPRPRTRLPRKARRAAKTANNVPEHMLIGALYHPDLPVAEPANDEG